MNIDNQKEYWDEVAEIKTFTHPIDLELINEFLNKQSIIVDFGCGYGRIVKQLTDLGLCWDQLIMGITSGVRVLINDKLTSSNEDRAVSVNIFTNEGFMKQNWNKYKL